MEKKNLRSKKAIGFFTNLCTLLSPTDEMRVKSREISYQDKDREPQTNAPHRMRSAPVPPFPRML